MLDRGNISANWKKISEKSNFLVPKNIYAILRSFYHLGT